MIFLLHPPSSCAFEDLDKPNLAVTAGVLDRTGRIGKMFLSYLCKHLVLHIDEAVNLQIRLAFRAPHI